MRFDCQRHGRVYALRRSSKAGCPECAADAKAQKLIARQEAREAREREILARKLAQLDAPRVSNRARTLLPSEADLGRARHHWKNERAPQAPPATSFSAPAGATPSGA